MRYRESGDVIWIEFHLLFPKRTFLEDAHRISTEIEIIIKETLKSKANIVIHFEPLEQHNETHDKID